MKHFLLTAIIGSTLLISGMNAQKIEERRERQQKRIAEGIESGQLTPKEAGKLEGKEARLNHEIRDDREDHGGKLTKKERRQVNRQQNRLSKDIYKQKHDAQKQNPK